MKTAKQILNSSDDFDCKPVFEAIVDQNHIIDLWVYSNEEHVAFKAAIWKQFVGTMHKNTDAEETFSSSSCGWIEDGLARKGMCVKSKAFFNEADALAWVYKQTAKIIRKQNKEGFAV